MANMSVYLESGRVKPFFTFLIFGICITTLFLSVQAQTIELSENQTPALSSQSSFNSDIQTIQNKIRQIKKIARSCTNGKCVNMPCRTVRKLNADVFNADYYLRHALVWNRVAFKHHRKHWEEYVNLQTATTERNRKLALQTAYLDFATKSVQVAADVGAIAMAFKNLDVSSLRDGSLLETLNSLDDLMKGVRSLENLRNLYRQQNGQDAIYTFQFNDPDLRLLHSTASNLKTIVLDAKKSGGNWPEAFKKETSQTAAIQIVTRAAIAFSQREINKRQERIRKTEKEIKENHRTMTATFNASRFYAARLNKIERAYAELNSLLTRNGEAYWLNCNRTNCILRPQPTVPSPPADFRVSFTAGNINNARPINRANWLSATRFFDEKLSRVAQMRFPDSALMEPNITLEKRVFEPGEIINAQFTAWVCYPARSWVGIIPSRIRHGDIVTNISTRIGNPFYLRSRTSGTIIQRAPNQEGKYDLRMNDIGSDKEVYSISFEVRKREETPTPRPTPQPTPEVSSENDGASWLIGRWEGYADSLGRRQQNEIGIVIEFVRENGKISGYIRRLSKKAKERRFRVGDKIYRNLVVGGKHMIWKFHASGGQGLWSTYSRYNNNGVKEWRGPATISIKKGKNWLDLTSTNFFTMRFRKIQ